MRVHGILESGTGMRGATTLAPAREGTGVVARTGVAAAPRARAHARARERVFPESVSVASPERRRGPPAPRRRSSANNRAATASSAKNRAVAALTIYDMTKALDKAITIESLQLLEKTGGKSGHFLRPETPRK
ncbi:hypothetical protein FBQ98_12355 [Gammaproteobacteria bacterium PRO6]|nr:hypothetical protein [Gammaproteobacteria bacterium PRO6]